MAHILSFRNKPQTKLAQCAARLRTYDAELRRTILHRHFIECDFSNAREIVIHLHWPSAESRLAVREEMGGLAVEHVFTHDHSQRRTTILRQFPTSQSALADVETELAFFLSQFSDGDGPVVETEAEVV